MKVYLKDVVLIMVFIFIGSSIFILINNKEKKDFSSVKEVDNSTQYYDISSIVNKFIRNSNNENKKILLNMLDSGFKKKNHITKENVLKKIPEFSNDNITFLGDKMYYEDLNNKISKVYVSGNIQSFSMDEYKNVEDYYVIVLIDRVKKVFSIIPDDGKTFKEVEKWMQK